MTTTNVRFMMQQGWTVMSSSRQVPVQEDPSPVALVLIRSEMHSGANSLEEVLVERKVKGSSLEVLMTYSKSLSSSFQWAEKTKESSNRIERAQLLEGKQREKMSMYESYL